MIDGMIDRYDEIASALQLGLLLEVSAYPKPGNVHRTRDFYGTRYEHFLASAAALGSHFRCAAARGRAIVEHAGTRMKIGERIRRAVETCSDWQHGGNTSLGAILLLVPIAYAAGMVPLDSPMQAPAVRKNLRKVVRGTTASDTVNAYRAISQASPGGLGRVPELDVNDPTSIAEIRKRGIFLRDIFRISARYDLISREWVSDFHVTFEIGLPFLRQELRATGDINSAIVDTYLKILSQMPDTLVARKSGMGAAKQISIRAKRVLEVGAMRTKRGRRAVEQMDKLIQRLGHCYNPGTTADLTASSASVLVLEGFRP